jgi:hypothetical protein
MSDKIIRFPKTFHDRMRNIHGDGYVPCEVTNRWLHVNVNGGEYIDVNVMTGDAETESKKICHLVLKREEILRLADKIRENN